ncbi:hypothetical protein OHR68_12725 [Spirillospora sp. NBC_00431]
MPTEEGPVSLGQLLALGVLPGHEVLGGADGLNRPLRYVLPGASPRQVGKAEAGTVVVFEADRLDARDPLAEVVIRMGSRAGIAGIILRRPADPVPQSTRDLANKLHVPVVLLDDVDAGAVVAALDAHVRRPEVAGARLLTELVQRLRGAPRRSEDLLRVLGAVLRCPISLVDSEGRTVAGDATASTALAGHPQRELLHRRRPALNEAAIGEGQLLLLQPLGLIPDAPANLWLAARLASTSPLLDASRRALEIASWAFTAYLANDTLAAERANRERALLLTDVLEHADAPPRHTVERATAAGWRLFGWHTAVHLTTDGTPATDAGLRLRECLSRHDLDADLIERPDGWAFWLTTDTDPGPAHGIQLGRTLRRALLQEGRHGLSVSAGIGRPHQGTAGLRQSLRDAHQAVLLARARGADGTVEHIEAMNITRLLATWYGSAALSEVARPASDPSHRRRPHRPTAANPRLLPRPRVLDDDHRHRPRRAPQHHPEAP